MYINGAVSLTLRADNYYFYYYYNRIPFFTSYPILAPFLTEQPINLLEHSNVWYRETNDPSLLRRAQRDIRMSFLSQVDFTPTSLFIVTWEQLEPYSIYNYPNLPETSKLIKVHT